MKEFKKILFPVDLSDVAPKIVPYVRAMAEKFDATIHLLFVVRVLHHYTTLYVPPLSISNLEQEMIQGGERKLTEFRAENFGDCPGCTAQVVVGDAAEAISNYVESEAIDLVIMGTHGRKGLEKVFFRQRGGKGGQNVPRSRPQYQPVQAKKLIGE